MKFPWRYWKMTLLLASSIDFFSVCFDTGFIPDEWNDSVITPIPVFYGWFAKSTKLQRHQLGACMLQALLRHFKLTWVDDNNLLCDEQNGFRKSRTTLDHLSTVMALTETQKALKKYLCCFYWLFKSIWFYPTTYFMGKLETVWYLWPEVWPFV